MSADPRESHKVTIQTAAVEVIVPDDKRVATYATAVWAATTERDFQFTFAQVEAITRVLGEQPSEARAHVVARVVLSPQTAAELLAMLAQLLNCRVVPNSGEPGPGERQ